MITPEKRAELRDMADAVLAPEEHPHMARWWDDAEVLGTHPIGQKADREFIVATPPDVVRGLLDDLDAAEAKRDRLADRLGLMTGLMDEYFDALRGSWGGIDGRSERHGWWNLRDHIAAGVGDKAQLRADFDLCPSGRGHWTEYCTESCTDRGE